MTLGLDPQQLASGAMELLKNHWTVVATPLAAGALKEAGSSLFNLVKGAFTSNAAAGALEEAAENPADPDKAAALEIQIKNAIKANPQFAESLRNLIGSIPSESYSRIIQKVTQTGDKNVGNQITGDSNKISTKIS